MSDVYAPIAGEVVEVNDALGSQSELINTDPFGKGFMIKIKVQNAADVDGLLSAGDYSGLIG